MTTAFQREHLLWLPLPLAQLYSRAHNAKDPRSRHDNAFYFFEALVKLTATPAIALYLQDVERGQPRVPDLTRLLEHLALPSLGQWVGILRELARHFDRFPDAASHPLGRLGEQLDRPRRDWPAVLALYRRIKHGADGQPGGDQSCSLLQLLDALVQYRNGVFGHSGPRFESFYEREMGPLLIPALNEVLAEGVLDLLGPRGSRLVYLTELRTLDDGRIEVGLRELVGLQGERAAALVLPAEQAATLLPNRLAVTWPGREVPLRLDPLLVYRENELAEEVLFLNRDRNGQQVEYLSYTTGRTERDRSTAAALAAMLSRISGQAIGEKQLQTLAEQSLTETSPVEAPFAPQPAAQRVLGDYAVLRELGRGGMGVVYLAQQLSLGRLVALKMLPADLAGDATALARFEREIRALARCEHPNIVKVFSKGTFPDGQLYFTMEYIPGCNLEYLWQALKDTTTEAGTAKVSPSWAQAIRTASRRQREHATRPNAQAQPGSEPVCDSTSREEPSPPAGPEPSELPEGPDAYTQRVAALLRDAAKAVQAVHSAGLVHRDVKLANVMLTPDGKRVVLMDFGLVKGPGATLSASRQGGLLGTLRYAAPEQLAAASLRVGPAADVRGLGVVLWELLTRQRLFEQAHDERALATLIYDQDVPPLRTMDARLDRDLEAIVARATERSVADRIPTAGRLAEYLQLYLEGKPLPIRPPGIRERLWRWARPRKGLVAAIASLVVVTTAAVVGLFLWTGAEQRRIQGLRQAAETDEQLALAEARADRPAGARRLAEEAAGRIVGVPELASLHARLEAIRDRAERLATFYRSLDETEFLANRLDRDEEAQAAARRSLESLGVFAEPEWWAHLPDEDLTEDQRERLREDIYREVVLLAGLHAKGAIRGLGRPEMHPPLRTAFEILEPARRFRRSHAVEMLETLCCLGLGRPQADAPSEREPVTAADFYLSGIAHLWFADAERHVNTFLPQGPVRNLLLRNVNLVGLDLKTPLTTAEQRLRMAARLEPRHYWTHCWLGVILARAKKHGERELAFNSCLALRPDYGIAYRFRGGAILAQLPQAANSQAAEALVARGLADLDHAVLLDQQAGSYEARAEGLLKVAGRLTDEAKRMAMLVRAISDLDEVIRIDPRSAAYYFRGNAWYAKQEYDRAIADYTEAIRLNPDDAFAYNNRGACWSAKREYDRAVADYTEVIRLDPKNAAAHNNRGAIWSAKREYDRAIVDHTEAIRLDPKNADAYGGRGNAWYAKREDDKAVADYTEAIRLDPKNVTAYYNRGNTWSAKREYDRAIADYTEAIRLDPKDAEALGGRGNAWYAKREHDKAIADHSEAVRLARKHPAAYGDRGVAWYAKQERAYIYHTAFSPDGRLYVTGGDTGLLSLWDAATGEQVREFQGHRGWTSSAVFTPCGKQILSGGVQDKSLRLWDVAMGNELRQFEGHTEALGDVAVSPDGKLALSGSSDRTLRIWELVTGKELRKLEGHTGRCGGIFSPDGKQVLSYSADKTLRLWDVACGGLMRSFEGHTEEVNGAYFLPGGRQIASYAYDRTLRLWDVASGEEMRQMDLGEDQCAIHWLAFTPDGKRFLTNHQDRSVRVRDLATGRELHRFELPHDVTPQGLSMSPDGQYGGYGSLRGFVYLFRLPK